MSRKAVTIGKEIFDFLAWKKPGHSFYAHGSDGELRVIALIGSGLPLRATRFRCEVDGITVPFESYQLLPLSLSEMAQLERLFPELRKDKPAGGGGDKTPPALRAKRSNAGKRKARVQDPVDIQKIKKAFAARIVGGGLTNNAVAKELAELVSEDPNTLDLKSGPYYNISPDAIRRLVGVKK